MVDVGRMAHKSHMVTLARPGVSEVESLTTRQLDSLATCAEPFLSDSSVQVAKAVELSSCQIVKVE